MATINIQILRSEPNELDAICGKSTEIETLYRPLKFKDSELIGYWVNVEEELITIYINVQEFICKWTKKNIETLDKIIDGD